MKWRVTYEVITEESAACGDIAEGGFINAEGWRTEALVGRPTPGVDMTLRNALRFVTPQEDVGRWLIEVDGRGHFTDAEGETRHALHPPENITPASYSRLCRLLGVQHNG